MRTIAFIIIGMLAGFSTAFAANSDKNFGGVGIDGAPRADGQIVVRQIVAGGPAHLAGLKPGDVLVSIDGKPTRGSDFREMVDRRLRGRAGTKVLLVVHRPGEKKLLRMELTRRQLVLPNK